MGRRVGRTGWVTAALAALAAVALAAALWAFEPWRLVTSSTIDEPLPTPNADRLLTDAPGATGPSAPQGAPPSGGPSPVVRDVQVLAAGRFRDAEHHTTGTARVLRLADGARYLRLEDLASSDGPDLHVWLSDRPGGGAWGSYDDGAHLELGDLKATHGNQNYPIPDDVDLEGLVTVVIWCDRFDVAFGTAALA